MLYDPKGSDCSPGPVAETTTKQRARWRVTSRPLPISFRSSGSRGDIREPMWMTVLVEVHSGALLGCEVHSGPATQETFSKLVLIPYALRQPHRLRVSLPHSAAARGFAAEMARVKGVSHRAAGHAVPP